MPQLSPAVTAMPRSGIRAVMDLAWATPGCIHLEVGEPSFPTPTHVLDAAARALRDGHTRYAPNAGLPELREALAGKVAKRNHLQAAPEDVVVTSGGIGALLTALLAVAIPGGQVLVPDPGWPNFAMITRLAGMEPVAYRLRADTGFLPTVNDLEEAAGPQARVLVLNSPSNPLGTVLPEPRLAELLAFARDRDLWVVSDECYDEIVLDPADGAGHVSAAAVAEPERVLSVFTFSKTYAMTGMRVGYVVGPPGTGQTLAKLQEATIACVNTPAQHAALAAVTGPQDAVGQMRAAYRDRRDAATALLDRHGLPYLRPSGAFYLWVDIHDRAASAHDFAMALLRDRQVALAPGTAFGPTGEGWVRLSLATDTDLLLEGVERLATFRAA